MDQSGGGSRDALSDRADMDTNVTHSPPLGPGPLPAYRALVAGGELASDSSQEDAAKRLQTLWEALRGYDPAPLQSGGNSLLGRLLRRKPVEPLAPERTPKCLYLVGELGRGTSMR